MTYTDSAIVTVTLDLTGVWLHDPSDPNPTARNFPYGSASRSGTIDVMGEGSYYAGRSAQVVDYGEHETETVSVSIQIPHGPEYRDDLDDIRAIAQSRAPYVYRDNRGRVLHGVVSDYREQDQRWGSQVSLLVSKVDG